MHSIRAEMAPSAFSKGILLFEARGQPGGELHLEEGASLAVHRDDVLPQDAEKKSAKLCIAGLRHVQAFLGHEHVRTTVIYTEVSATKLREVHRATHPFEKSRSVVCEDGFECRSVDHTIEPPIQFGSVGGLNPVLGRRRKGAEAAFSNRRRAAASPRA